MYRLTQAEHAEVLKRGNHGKLSAQLHNEKRTPLVVSILHVMLCFPLSADQTSSASPHAVKPSLGQWVSKRDGDKTAHKYEPVKNIEKHPVSYPQKTHFMSHHTNWADALQMTGLLGYHDWAIPCLADKEKHIQSCGMCCIATANGPGFCHSLSSFLVVLRTPSNTQYHSATLRTAVIWKTAMQNPTWEE